MLNKLNVLLQQGKIEVFLKESVLLENMDFPVSPESIESIDKLIENIEKNKRIIATQILSLRKSLLYINRV